MQIQSTINPDQLQNSASHNFFFKTQGLFWATFENLTLNLRFFNIEIKHSNLT